MAQYTPIMDLTNDNDNNDNNDINNININNTSLIIPNISSQIIQSIPQHQRFPAAHQLLLLTLQLLSTSISDPRTPPTPTILPEPTSTRPGTIHTVTQNPHG
jgi:hypothetical protein